MFVFFIFAISLFCLLVLKILNVHIVDVKRRPQLCDFFLQLLHTIVLLAHHYFESFVPSETMIDKFEAQYIQRRHERSPLSQTTVRLLQGKVAWMHGQRDQQRTIYPCAIVLVGHTPLFACTQNAPSTREQLGSIWTSSINPLLSSFVVGYRSPSFPCLDDHNES